MPKPKQKYTPKQIHLGKQDYRIPLLKKQISAETKKLRKLKQKLKLYE